MLSRCVCIPLAKSEVKPSCTADGKLDPHEVCFQGTWYSDALNAQRLLFAEAENQGVSISEDRIGTGENFVNIVTATAAPGEANRKLRRAARTGPIYEQLETMYRPGTVAIEGRPVGRVLVLLAGAGSGIGLFAYILPALVDYYEAIWCVDLPGFGLSARWAPTPGSVLLDYAYQLRTVMVELERQEPLFRTARTRVLAAHSTAAVIAVEYLRRYSETRFHVLTLISPIGIPPAAWVPPRNEELTRAGRVLLRLSRFCARRKITPQTVLRSFLRKRAAYRFFSNALASHLTMFEAPELVTHYLFLLNIAPCPAERSVYELLANGEFEDTIKDLEEIRKKTPINFIVGDEDFVPYQVSSAVQQSLNTGAYMRVVNHTAHLPFLENIPQFAHEFITTFREAVLWMNEHERSND